MLKEKVDRATLIIKNEFGDKGNKFVELAKYIAERDM